MIKKILLFAVSAFILSAPLGVLAQVTTHGGGTGLVDVSSGSIPFGSVFNIRLATSSAFQFNNAASRLTVTYASTTGISTAYASSTNYLGANLATCTTTNALTWNAGFFGCVAIPQGTVTSVTATNPLFSTGGATPVISTIFGTTTTWGLGNNGVIMTGATGIPFSIATSSALALSITGNAATVTTNANLTGVVTSVGNATSIAANALTLTMFPQVSANRLLGNSSGASANAAEVATSSLFTGSVGQFDYFASTGGLVGTSSLFLATNTHLGVGTTTPWAQLSIAGLNPATGSTPLFNVASSTSGTLNTSLFSILAGGQITLGEQRAATSTTIVLDWSITARQVNYQIGTAAVTISIINATTSQFAGSTKIVWICNPQSAAGALTWAGVEWVGGTVPAQTTTANQCDVYSLDVTNATSTSAFKVAGTQGAGFQ